ncbi:MAG: biopolymer transporter ExbD [Myxococcota bacterium]|jgi:biopolymer transport protein ExbD|nr:biopolymer transporter ExbD [Myxococcota bacterium]
MARKPSERAHGEEVDADLNLVPIMAILVILIPVLLYAFTFFEVRVQAVAAPRLGPAKKTEKKDEDKEKPLNLTVLVTKDGFAIKQQAELMEGEEPPIPKRTFMIKGKEVVEYDYPALYTRVRQKKIKHPDETTINVGAEMDIPWQTIARTIDATRVVLCKPAVGKEEVKGEDCPAAESYEDIELYTKAEAKLGKDTNGDGVKDPVDMFPAVVFVVAE